MRQGEHSLVVSFSSWQRLSCILCIFIIQWVTSTRKKQGEGWLWTTVISSCAPAWSWKMRSWILLMEEYIYLHIFYWDCWSLMHFVLWNQQKCFKLIGAGVQQLYDITNMCYLTSGWCVLNICHLLILCVLELSFHS